MAENVSPQRSLPVTPPELLGTTLGRSLILAQPYSSTEIARLLNSLTPPSTLPCVELLRVVYFCCASMTASGSTTEAAVLDRAEEPGHFVFGEEESRSQHRSADLCLPQPRPAPVQQLAAAAAAATGAPAVQPKQPGLYACTGR